MWCAPSVLLPGSPRRPSIGASAQCATAPGKSEENEPASSAEFLGFAHFPFVSVGGVDLWRKGGVDGAGQRHTNSTEKGKLGAYCLSSHLLGGEASFGRPRGRAGPIRGCAPLYRAQIGDELTDFSPPRGPLHASKGWICQTGGMEGSAFVV